MSTGLQIFEEDEVESDSGGQSVFVTEFEETINEIESEIIGLESSADSEKTNKVFRLFHNLKGSSGMMSFSTVKDIAHYCEFLLDRTRKTNTKISAQDVDIFLDALESLKKILTNLKTSGKEGDQRFFLLLHRLEEASLAASPGTVPELVAAEKSTVKTESKPREDSPVNDNEQIKVSKSVIDQMMLLVGEFMLLKNRIEWLKSNYNERDFDDNCQEMGHFSGKLQRNILKLRLSPVAPVLNQMKRVARTSASKVGKKIELEINGGETMLDRTILDKLADPLIHMIRNSVDHGIEDEETRISLNKPPVGQISLKAMYRSGEVLLIIQDDGGGINHEKIKDIAITKKFITETEANAMSQAELLKCIFLPGFSGAAVVTETSGRGVGMDVVRDSIEGVGGQIEINTEIGSGTTFTFRLPLSLAIIDCLGFQVGSQSYAIPQLNVDEVYSIDSMAAIENTKKMGNGNLVLVVRNTPIPIISLPKILGKTGSKVEALIQVRYNRYRFILQVGKILGPLSIISQPVPSAFARSPFSGITNQGDGSLLFLLDVAKMSNFVESTSVEKMNKSENRGNAGTSQEGTLLTTSDIKRLQQKTITFNNRIDFCLPVQRAKRIVFITHSQITLVGNQGKSFVTIEGETIPLVWVEEVLANKQRVTAKSYSLLIFVHKKEQYGIPMQTFNGIQRMPENYDVGLAEKGILGSTVLDQRTHLAIDIPGLVSLYLNEEGSSSSPSLIKEKRLKILCAEDDKFFASELQATLRGAKYETILAYDGLEAKNLLQDGDFYKEIDLIITDIEMPNMTGLALIRWIKSIERLRQIPIIAYTAISTVEMREKIMAAGALAYVSKMALDELTTVAANIISGKDDKGFVQSTEQLDTRIDRVVTFTLGQDWYALPMKLIKEVSAPTLSASVPSSRKWIHQVTSFRGQMIPLLDLSVYFDPDSDRIHCDQAVVDFEGSVFALKVGRIGEVLIKSQLTKGYGLGRTDKNEERIAEFISEVLMYENQIISLLDGGRLGKLCLEHDDESTKTA